MQVVYCEGTALKEKTTRTWLWAKGAIQSHSQRRILKM